jgi:hypothetical protein
MAFAYMATVLLFVCDGASLGYSTRMEVEPGNCSTERAPRSMLGV